MLYLVPDTGDVEQISELASRTKIPLRNPKNVRDFILSTATDTIALIAVSEDVLLVLSRHAKTLFPDELPMVLQSVPGLIYQPGWATMGTVFPPTHFREFAEMTKRSGVLSTNATDLESRGKGAQYIDNRTPSAMNETVTNFDLPDDHHDETDS